MSKPEVNRYYADCNKLGICERDECDVQVVLASSYDVLSAQRNELLGLLRECRGIIVELCQTYGNPTPDATLERIDTTLERHKC